MIGAMESPYTQDELRERLEEELDLNKLKFFNKAAIARDLGCSPTTIFRWLDGVMPKDPGKMHQFCKKYGIDMMYWVSGERSTSAKAEMAVDTDLLEDALVTVDAVAYKTGENLTYGDRADLSALMLLKDGQRNKTGGDS